MSRRQLRNSDARLAGVPRLYRNVKRDIEQLEDADKSKKNKSKRIKSYSGH
jgi:hypothetical protein